MLFSIGRTRVICTASVDADTPRWLRGTGRGWVSAEYGMLPASTGQRKQRDSSRGRPDGRSIEIQRLIGRSLRAIVDLEALGERTVWVDCDVLQADGGTRCASICGGYVALHRALSALVDAGTLAELPLTAGVAAVSCGIVEGEAVLDLDYHEDSSAEVDLNVVMTSGGRLVEVQGTAEGQPFDRAQLDRLLELGAAGMERDRGRAAAGGRCPPMSRLRAVLATGNAGKAAELSRLLGVDVRGAADRGRRERRQLRRQRAAQGARRAVRAPPVASGSATTRGSRSRRSAASRGCTRRAGPVRPTPIATPRCSRGCTAPRIARRPSCARSPRCCPTVASSSSRSASTARSSAAPRGEAGFGYDPLFVPAGEQRTVAQLAPDEKDALSHRGRASRALVGALQEAGAL